MAKIPSAQLEFPLEFPGAMGVNSTRSPRASALSPRTGTRKTARRARPPVEVRTSPRRRKTASASWEDGKVVVVLPPRLPRSERAALVKNLVERVLAQRPLVSASDADLQRRSALLADRYLGGVRPFSIRWVSNQQRRWASCTTHTGEIRISNRLRVVPNWVLDAVLVHELAHLVEPIHSQRFRRLANRYPRMAEADTFLAGFTLGMEYSG